MKHTVGVLKVTVVKAEDLTASDPNGKSDPFCVLHFSQQEESTPVVPNSLNPKWNHTVRPLVTGCAIVCREYPGIYKSMQIVSQSM